MKITYDPEADVLYIQFSKKRPVYNIDIESGVSYDLDQEGHLIGVEILDARKRYKTRFNKVEFIHYPLPIKKRPQKRIKKRKT
ncbi:DUF2283 domain-containing protein [bacterium]|nr:DUF2283 domain-containing protein [bacterium]